MNARTDPQTLTARPVPADPSPVHDARDLTGPAGLARLVLDGQVYQLRITRAGKLILTK
jgi:hemin uptake protein HemP